ncbi:MAG: pyruvate ferredoxin oxidoreductase subunit gamma [Candidatus Bathyarchaeia archaeon]
MKEIRFHGRGGQGTATAADLLAKAASYDGKYVQSFPFFGAERRGAPVTAYTRISNSPIWLREPIYNPDVVVVLDHVIWKYVNVTEGLKEDGIVLLNAKESPAKAQREVNTEAYVYTVDATGIALEVLKRPITNTVMLGALVAAAKIVTLDSIKKAIASRFVGSKVGPNIKAVELASTKVRGPQK